MTTACQLVSVLARVLGQVTVVSVLVVSVAAVAAE